MTHASASPGGVGRFPRRMKGVEQLEHGELHNEPIRRSQGRKCWNCTDMQARWKGVLKQQPMKTIDTSAHQLVLFEALPGLSSQSISIIPRYHTSPLVKPKLLAHASLAYKRGSD